MPQSRLPPQISSMEPKGTEMPMKAAASCSVDGVEAAAKLVWDGQQKVLRFDHRRNSLNKATKRCLYIKYQQVCTGKVPTILIRRSSLLFLNSSTTKDLITPHFCNLPAFSSLHSRLHHLPSIQIKTSCLITTLGPFFGLASADLFVTTWSGDNCQGSSQALTANRQGPSHVCFQHLPGGSFSVDAADGRCSITTWSGVNCEGSSANFDGSHTGCNVVPFGSIQLYTIDFG